MTDQSLSDLEGRVGGLASRIGGLTSNLSDLRAELRGFQSIAGLIQFVTDAKACAKRA
jgi:hypothetical protein